MDTTEKNKKKMRTDKRACRSACALDLEKESENRVLTLIVDSAQEKKKHNSALVQIRMQTSGFDSKQFKH